MLEWCMAHPWMTFILALLALVVVDSAVTNVFRIVNNVIIVKHNSRKTR